MVQGEELYEGHNGEQVSFDEAIARCPFLRSFGETALQEVRERMEAYRVEAQEISVGGIAEPKEISNSNATNIEDEVETEELEVISAQQSISNVETKDYQPDVVTAAEEVVQALLTRDAALAEEATAIDALHDRNKTIPTPEPGVKVNKTKLAEEPMQITGRKEVVVRLSGTEDYLGADVEDENLQTFEEAIETDFESSADDVDEFAEPEVAHNVAEKEFAMPEIAGETLLEVREEIFGNKPEDPETVQAKAELEETFFEGLEGLDEAGIEDLTADMQEAYAAIVEISETLAELNGQDEVNESWQFNEVELEENLETQIEKLEEICQQLLEKLDIPVEGKNIQLMMDLLLQPEFVKSLNEAFEIYEKGTHEAKTATAAVALGKKRFKEFKDVVRCLGERASAHIQFSPELVAA